MKPETLQRLRFSTAELVRAAIAGCLFWEYQLPPRNVSVLRNRRRLQRAALKAQGDPVGFVEKYLGWDFTTDAKLPERAAVSLSEILVALAPAVQDSVALREFVASEQSERQIVRQLRALFSSLAARPGRGRLDKYRRAADLPLNVRTSMHKLCVQLEPGYASMRRDEQRKVRNRMRSGLARALRKATQTAERTKPPL
jgi:hypothetical protein